MKPKKKLSPDRAKQVATTLERYGKDHYKKLGEMNATFAKDRELAKRAGKLGAAKRWGKEKV